MRRGKSLPIMCAHVFDCTCEPYKPGNHVMAHQGALYLTLLLLLQLSHMPCSSAKCHINSFLGICSTSLTSSPFSRAVYYQSLIISTFSSTLSWFSCPDISSRPPTSFLRPLGLRMRMPCQHSSSHVLETNRDQHVTS